ncbi:hypothetical protein LWI28_018000 [Acer negundo]|uniref:Uncharacterized protein n=1 Tax=Acer negundo TaxID=4023 RepID=A0AAD5NLW0_ACENE|nr:hypothetical protein LWI28_018000 [Acer negundo]
MLEIAMEKIKRLVMLLRVDISFLSRCKESSVIEALFENSTILESHSKEIDIGEVLEEIKCAMKDILGSLFQHLVGHLSEEAHITTSSSEHCCSPNTAKTAGSQILLDQHDKFVADSKTTVQQDLTSAVSHILQFVLSLGRKAMQVPDNGHGFIRASEPHFGVLGFKGCDEDVNSCDYVDKVTLLENKVGQDDVSNSQLMGAAVFLIHVTLRRFFKTKFYAQILDQMLHHVNAHGKLEELSLTETHSECMTESYKSLELHAEELDSEVKLLREKTKELDNELLEEKHIHQDALARCKDLQDIAQRCKSCSICSLSSGADSGIKTKQQEREIADAAEKLAECQETIYLLGKHLQALHPKEKLVGLSLKRLQCGESLVEDKPSDGCSKPDLRLVQASLAIDLPSQRHLSSSFSPDQ